jgi:hypothetical protein
MSYCGWNGKDDSTATGKLLDVTIALRQAGIRRDFVVRLNDSGLTFDEMADNIDHRRYNRV